MKILHTALIFSILSVSIYADKLTSLTPLAYIDRFNQSLKNINYDMQMKIIQEKNNPHEITTIGSSDGNFQILFSSDKTSHKIKSLMLISAYSKQNKDMIDVLFGLASSVMAIENPKMKKPERTAVAKNFRQMIAGEKDIFWKTISGEDIAYRIQRASEKDGMLVISVKPI